MPIPREPVQNLTSDISGLRVDLRWDVSGLSGDPYYQNYGCVIVERTFKGSTVVMDPLPALEEQWSDDGADVGGFQAGDTIFYMVKTMDGAGNQASVPLTVVVKSGGSPGGGGGGGGCFIATASYGTATEPEVESFRAYRDNYLAKRSWGRALLKAYYALSPRPARIIDDRPLLRSVSRTLLEPILWTLRRPGAESALPALVGMAIVIMILTVPLLLLYFLIGGILKVRSEGRYFMRR